MPGSAGFSIDVVPMITGHRASESIRPVEHAFAIDVRGEPPGRPDLVFRAGQQVAIDDNEIRQLAWLERTDPVLQERRWALLYV